MILCEWDTPEGDPGQSCVHLYARILSSSLTSVSIFSVCCYSIVSISMAFIIDEGGGGVVGNTDESRFPEARGWGGWMRIASLFHLYRLHTAILNRPLSNAATKEV
jgi:hypothetical protein